MFRENRLGFFLSFSVAAHLIVLILFAAFFNQTQKKDITIIEVALLKIDAGSVSLGKLKDSSKPVMKAVVPYRMKNDNSNNLFAAIKRKFSEPDYNPVSSSVRSGEDNSRDSVKQSKPNFSSSQSASSSKTDIASNPGREIASEYVGSRLGVEGPASGRKILYYEYPLYPEWAQRKGVDARVELKFWVSEEGYIEDVVVMKKGDLQLDNLAAQALKKWRFEPVKGTRQWGKIKMTFELKSR